MTKHPADAAVLVAPLNATEITAPSCELELNVFALYRLDKLGDTHGGYSQSKFLPVWVRPDSLANALKAKKALSPGWVIDESWTANTMPKGAWLAVDRSVYGAAGLSTCRPVRSSNYAS